MQKLPDKLSELIRVGLEDVRKAEDAADTYVVDMGSWHDPPGCRRSSHSTRCSVCMAGAVMAFHLGVPADEEKMPRSFGDDSRIRSQLRALDHCVWGGVGQALEEIGAIDNRDDLPEQFRGVVISDYDSHPKMWHAELNKLADALEAAGY